MTVSGRIKGLTEEPSCCCIYISFISEKNSEQKILPQQEYLTAHFFWVRDSRELYCAVSTSLQTGAIQYKQPNSASGLSVPSKREEKRFFITARKRFSVFI